MCPHCEGLHPAFREGRTVTLFQGPARALVIALKYHHGLHVTGDLETVIRGNDRVTSFVRDAILVPVPLHPRKEREREYNQSHILAEAFARSVDGCATVQPLLRRVVDTQSQTTYDRLARRTNLKNAFALAEGVSITPDQHYILVDDVFTTGSTLNSCARELRRAGSLNLDVITFGHG
ncbi:ComF family protein [Opitutaceae bacterium]